MKGKSRRSYTTLLMFVVMTALISITAVKAEAAPEVVSYIHLTLPTIFRGLSSVGCLRRRL